MNTTVIRPDVRAFLDLFNSTPLSRLEDLPVDQTRAWMAQMRAAAPPVPHDLAMVRDLTIERPGRPLPLRVYDKRPQRAASPIVVYFHGGGFVLGDLESHQALCVAMADQLDLPVVAVDYRLAPEHPWPAAPEDAEFAARWVAEQAREALGCDATSLVLAGDSAGANLAAVTAAALRDAPASIPVIAQFLMYPCTAVEADTPSKREFAEGLFLTRSGMDWFFRQYGARAGDPRVDLHAFDQAAMPPTVLVTAALDPLRDEGRAYAAALIAAGVPTTYQELAGNIHGCFSMCAAIPSTNDDLRRALAALRILVTP